MPFTQLSGKTFSLEVLSCDSMIHIFKCPHIAWPFHQIFLLGTLLARLLTRLIRDAMILKACPAKAIERAKPANRRLWLIPHQVVHYRHSTISPLGRRFSQSQSSANVDPFKHILSPLWTSIKDRTVRLARRWCQTVVDPGALNVSHDSSLELLKAADPQVGTALHRPDGFSGTTGTMTSQ